MDRRRRRRGLPILARAPCMKAPATRRLSSSSLRVIPNRGVDDRRALHRAAAPPILRAHTQRAAYRVRAIAHALQCMYSARLLLVELIGEVNRRGEARSVALIATSRVLGVATLAVRAAM